MLYFKSFEDKYFFWLQDNDDSLDEKFVSEVNEMINKNLDEENDK